MAADWIPMRVDLAEDPAVIAIACATGLDEDTVVGKLHRLWSWFNTHTKNGHAPVTPVWINAKIRHEKFAEAMISVGWLLVRENKIVLPRFDRWNSQGGKARILATRRKQRQRSRQQRDTKRDNLGTREEKRRVEELYPPDNEEIDSSEARRQSAPRARSRAPTFTAPTVDEVAAYCRERKNAVDAEAFVAFYESCGWKVGNKPMRKWKSAVVTWEKRRGYQNGRSDQNVGQSRVPIPDGKLEEYERRSVRVDASAPS